MSRIKILKQTLMMEYATTMMCIRIPFGNQQLSIEPQLIYQILEFPMTSEPANYHYQQWLYFEEYSNLHHGP